MVQNITMGFRLVTGARNVLSPGEMEIHWSNLAAGKKVRLVNKIYPYGETVEKVQICHLRGLCI